MGSPSAGFMGSPGRPDGGTAWVHRAAVLRQNPVLPGAIPPLAASVSAAWAQSRHLDFLSTDELRLQLGLPVLKQHSDDFGQVLLQLAQGFPLRMRAGQTRNLAAKQPSVRPPPDHAG